MKKIIKKIRKLLGYKEEIGYPPIFAIIDYSPEALRKNILNEQNKFIYVYKYDYLTESFEVEKLEYSKASLYVLKHFKKIPIYDKSKKEIRFPVFARILPSEIEYHRK